MMHTRKSLTSIQVIKTATGKYICTICGYVYDPAVGDPSRSIPPGTAFEDLPDNWRCPRCKNDKSKFNRARSRRCTIPGMRC